MPRVVIRRQARDQLAALPSLLQEAVENAIDHLARDPRAIGYPLMGRLRGRRSAKVGNYRVIYTIEGSLHELVVVQAIRHRAVPYGYRRR